MQSTLGSHILLVLSSFVDGSSVRGGATRLQTCRATASNICTTEAGFVTNCTEQGAHRAAYSLRSSRNSQPFFIDPTDV
jgi:hypothetical protein